MASQVNCRKNFKPIFHGRDKAEDNNELSKVLINQARKSGSLNLSGRGLATVPDKVWNLNQMEDNEVNIDLKNSKEEEAWWNQEPLNNLDLSSNHLTTISRSIENLFDLTVLNLHDNALTTLPNEIGRLQKLTKLNLSHNKITILPDDFFKLKELKYLNLSHNSFTEISSDLCDLYVLEYLDLSYNQLTSISGGIGFLVRLTELILSFNKLKELPNDIVSLRSLQKLDLMNNDLEMLPSVMGELRKLDCLYAQHNDIKELPDFTGCTALKEIHISNNFIKEIPTDFCENLPQLKILDLRDNQIEKLPEEIAMLESLIRLDLSNNSINSLPNSLATLAHLISLQLDGNPIRSIRRDIIQCGANRILQTLQGRAKKEDKMEIKSSATIGDNKTEFPDRYKMRKSRNLTLSLRDLSDVPDEVFKDAKEEHISLIDLSKNRFTQIPNGIIHTAESLNELIVSQNALKVLPTFLSKFERLTLINVSKNYLTDLPTDFSTLNLRELNISFNKFNKIPNCIYSMKNLEILLIRDNQIENIDATESGLGAMKQLATLDLSNNNISQVPAILGNLQNITTLELNGNRFRQPRHQILAKGTDTIMAYLRDRIPT